MVRTFEQRVTEVFAVFGKYPPFKTIEEYTEWYLAKRAIDMTVEAQKLEEMYRVYSSRFEEVPMDELENKVVDVISVVDSHIDDFGWWEHIDTDQFLTVGQEIQTGQDVVIYKQGYARAV